MQRRRTYALALCVALYVLARDHENTQKTGNSDDAARASAYILGLSRPVQNALDPRYTDADGDLLADVPTDAAKQQNPDTLVFSFLVSQGPEAKEATWKDFVAALHAATGKPVEFRAGGLLARAIQHETDHLNGILFIDRMERKKKEEFREERNHLHSGDDIRRVT